MTPLTAPQIRRIREGYMCHSEAKCCVQPDVSAVIRYWWNDGGQQKVTKFNVCKNCKKTIGQGWEEVLSEEELERTKPQAARTDPHANLDWSGQ